MPFLGSCVDEPDGTRFGSKRVARRREDRAVGSEGPGVAPGRCVPPGGARPKKAPQHAYEWQPHMTGEMNRD